MYLTYTDVCAFSSYDDVKLHHNNWPLEVLSFHELDPVRLFYIILTDIYYFDIQLYVILIVAGENETREPPQMRASLKEKQFPRAIKGGVINEE